MKSLVRGGFWSSLLAGHWFAIPVFCARLGTEIDVGTQLTTMAGTCFGSATQPPRDRAGPRSGCGAAPGAILHRCRHDGGLRAAQLPETFYRRRFARPAGTRTVVWYQASPTWSRTRSSAKRSLQLAARVPRGRRVAGRRTSRRGGRRHRRRTGPPQPGSAPGARVWACPSDGASRHQGIRVRRL
jgi:hypothetical protein